MTLYLDFFRVLKTRTQLYTRIRLKLQQIRKNIKKWDKNLHGHTGTTDDPKEEYMSQSDHDTR